MESIQLVLIGNTDIDSVAILASAKKSQFTSRTINAQYMLEDIAKKIYEHRPKANYWYIQVVLNLVN